MLAYLKRKGSRVVSAISHREEDESYLLPNAFIGFSLPATDRPQTSIIIPTFNHWSHTYNCLLSILNNSDGIAYEVIIVDNGSTDETLECLDRIANLIVLKNDENEGYTKACNKGSRIARGEYLLFLNNDCKLKKGCLLALKESLDKFPEVGAVGAKLLYPDNRLQEAGAIIWNDAGAHNYGRGDNYKGFAYDFLREVDYCSGACLMIRRNIFERVNGFDERYSPAYYEDVDLCFAVRALGYRVIYQPRAEVVHFEGATAGVDPSGGYKRFQDHNKYKFYNKWQSVLEEQSWPPGLVLLWRARRQGKRRELLIVDHRVPTYDRDGGSFRLWNVINLFHNLSWNISYYPDNLEPLEPYTSQLQQAGVEVIYGQVTFENFLRERCEQFDLVWLARPDISFNKIGLVRTLSPKARIVYDTVDLNFLREARRAGIENVRGADILVERYKNMELNLSKTADVTLVVTKDERMQLLNLEPSLNVRIIPTIHPVTSVQSLPFAERSGIMFIGDYLHRPNVDAVKWFLERIWPHIVKGLPYAEFYIVGGSMPGDVARFLHGPGIRIVGWVPDPGPWFSRCKVFVCPLRYGAGMKGKIGQAMSYGLPVVTTSIGAEGMDLAQTGVALVRDDPYEFAQAVIALYTCEEVWLRMSSSGRKHVSANYSPEVVQSRLSEILKELGLCGLEY